MTKRKLSLQRILVASDFSEQSDIAIDRAVELAIEHEAELIIVHVIDEDSTPYVQNYLTTVNDHQFRTKLEENPRAQQITKTIDIVVGRPDLDIVERAEIDEVDLIVVGLHSRILEENLPIQGSVVERIIQAAHVPVLVVKNQPEGPYSSVVVGIDFSAYSQAAIQSAVSVAPTATFRLVHAFHKEPNMFARFRDSEAGSRSQEQRAARMKGFAAREMEALEARALQSYEKKPNMHHVFEEGEAHDILKSSILNAKTDLMCVGTHGRLGITRALLGSVATEVLNDRLIDVLVVRPY